MADRATEFLDLKVQQLTPAEYLKISQVTGQRAGQDIPSFGIAKREQELETTRICAFCGFEGATRNSRDAHGRQRYWRRQPADGGCGRTFAALTGTPFLSGQNGPLGSSVDDRQSCGCGLADQGSRDRITVSDGGGT